MDDIVIKRLLTRKQSAVRHLKKRMKERYSISLSNKKIDKINDQIANKDYVKKINLRDQNRQLVIKKICLKSVFLIWDSEIKMAVTALPRESISCLRYKRPLSSKNKRLMIEHGMVEGNMKKKNKIDCSIRILSSLKRVHKIDTKYSIIMEMKEHGCYHSKYNCKSKNSVIYIFEFGDKFIPMLWCKKDKVFFRMIRLRELNAYLSNSLPTDQLNDLSDLYRKI